MAAEMLGVTTSYIRRMIRNNKLKGVKLGHEWILNLKTIEAMSFKKKTVKTKE